MTIAAKIKIWFQSTKRDLPWRENPTPYAVWVSEVMLQQTQVSVVIPYFLRWMERFPTVEKLAEASLEEVIKSWEGLGYYSRARNLHEGARYVVEHYGGILPKHAAALKKIKGIGDYTLGAILSFAFHQREAAVDGNVMRVLARYYAIEEDICKVKTQKKMKAAALDILPEEEPWVIMEALIELGATVCAKKAQCSLCPLQATCKAWKSGKVDQLPFKSAKVKIEQLFRAVSIIQSKGAILVRKAGKGEIMSDLYEFPYFETDAKGLSSLQLKERLSQKLNLETIYHKALQEASHGFTRYQVQLFPHLFSCDSQKVVEGYTWVDIAKLSKLPFSSGHRRILSNILNPLNAAFVNDETVLHEL